MFIYRYIIAVRSITVIDVTDPRSSTLHQSISFPAYPRSCFARVNGLHDPPQWLPLLTVDPFPCSWERMYLPRPGLFYSNNQRAKSAYLTGRTLPRGPRTRLKSIRFDFRKLTFLHTLRISGFRGLCIDRYRSCKVLQSCGTIAHASLVERFAGPNDDAGILGCHGGPTNTAINLILTAHEEPTS